MSYKKLVRDNIPEIIRAKGQTPITRTLDDEEYLKELVRKLDEEVGEFKADQDLKELADIQEVVLALAAAIGASKEQLESVRSEKAAKNGAFQRKIYLEDVQ
jgi:predicted house-cleaning noncanonical NTP pyrophosphatase (MazG superfamily)